MATSGILARWKFGGDYKDSVGANHGTAVGNPVFGTDGSRSYVQLDGNDYINVPCLPIFSSSFTFSVWVNLDNAADSNTNYPFSAWSGPWAFRFYVSQEGPTLNCRVSPLPLNELNFGKNANPKLVAKTWYHIAAVWNREQGVAKVFVNGKVTNTANKEAFTMPPGMPNFQIGRKGDQGQPYYAGKLADLIVWNKPLSDANIQEVYDGTFFNLPSTAIQFTIPKGTTPVGFTVSSQVNAGSAAMSQRCKVWLDDELVINYEAPNQPGLLQVAKGARDRNVERKCKVEITNTHSGSWQPSSTRYLPLTSDAFGTTQGYAMHVVYSDVNNPSTGVDDYDDCVVHAVYLLQPEIDDFTGDDLTDAEKTLIKGWFPPGTRFTPFYQATVNGWNQSDFYNRPEAQGRYLIFGTTDTTTPYVFGGYAPEGFKYAEKAGAASTRSDTFTFSLRNPTNTPKQFKASNANGTNAYYIEGPWHSNFGANDMIIDTRRGTFHTDPYKGGASMLESAGDTFYTGVKDNFLKEIKAYKVTWPSTDFDGSDFTSAEKELISGWFPLGTRFKLFYQASVNGWNQSDFYNKPEAQGKYLIFGTTDTTTPYLFGGYAPDGFKYAEKAGAASVNRSTFTFSLRNPSNTPKQFKASNTTGTNAYYIEGPWHSNFGANDMIIDTRRGTFHTDPYKGGATMLESAGDTFYTGVKDNFLKEITAYQVVLP